MSDKSGPPALNAYAIIALWLVLIGICTVIFTRVLNDKNNPNREIQIEFNENGDANIVLKQDQQGHYRVSGMINNKNVDFLVDTGATYVAIPDHLASQLNLKKYGTFDSMTANGISQSFYTTINSLTIGEIQVLNVPASISTGMTFDEVLLGMSYLRHFEITQKARELIITVPQNDGL